MDNSAPIYTLSIWYDKDDRLYYKSGGQSRFI